jgi:hypothetical protein
MLLKELSEFIKNCKIVAGYGRLKNVIENSLEFDGNVLNPLLYSPPRFCRSDLLK